MIESEVSVLEVGLYLIKWKTKDGGNDYSVAAVGIDREGRYWYAPTNWVTVPWYDWDRIDSVELLTTQELEISRARLRSGK